MQIKKHAVASIQYTLKNDAEEILDASEEGQPLAYVHGVGGLIPGLEAELEGKSAGARFKIRIAPEQGYGVRDEERVARVPRSEMPQDETIEQGMQFQAHGPDGVEVLTVVGLEPDVVLLDANHPLAGVHLNFDVTVIEVRVATADELAHGHVHGPGGHHHH